MTAFKEMTVDEIARAVDGSVQGDGARRIRRVMTLEEAEADDLSFLSNTRYAKLLATTRAGAVIVAKDVEAAQATLIHVAQPYLAFAHALTLMAEETPPEGGIHAGAHVHPDAILEADVTIMPGSYVGAGARIGAGSILYPGAIVLADTVLGPSCQIHSGAVVREACRLGARVILNANATIGGDGFGFAQDGARYVKIPQVGHVEIGDDVEIGAGSTIDRAALGATVIGRGTKIDNLVQIAHGCKVGEDVLIVAQSGLAGSATIGDRATLAARAGILGHLTVGAGTVVYSRAHVTKSIAPGSTVSGNPARPHRERLRRDAAADRIGKLSSRIDAMREEIRELKNQLATQNTAHADGEPESTDS